MNKLALMCFNLESKYVIKCCKKLIKNDVEINKIHSWLRWEYEVGRIFKLKKIIKKLNDSKDNQEFLDIFKKLKLPNRHLIYYVMLSDVI